MTNSVKWNDGQVHQGDIYKDIDYIEYAEVVNGRVKISKIRFQYVMVLSQECDLTQDFTEREKYKDKAPITHDKLLQSVIVVPMFNFEHFKSGTHLSNLGFTMSTSFNSLNKSPAKTLMQNNNPRYHYLEFDESITIVPSVMDFKRFFTVDINFLYRMRTSNYVCSVDTLFRERVSQRFSNFLSRIGLPDKCENNHNLLTK